MKGQGVRGSARVIGIPDDAVACQGEPAWACGGIWQRVFVNDHRRRIDRRNLVGTKFNKNRNAFWVHLDAVRARLRRRRFDQLDLASLWIEPSDHVGLLDREPDDPVLIKRERMRVARFRVRHWILGNVASLGVELTDQREVISGEPNVAVLIFN
jgi:hypothetical protein